MSGVARLKHVILACGVAALLAGCGGGDTGAGSETGGRTGATADTDSAAPVVPVPLFVERADEVCRQLVADFLELRVQERLREIQKGSGPESEKFERFADVLSEQLAVVSQFRQRFEALGVPSEHRDDAERLVVKARSAEEALGRAIDAFRAGDGDEATEAMQRYGGFSQQSASIARDSELNFTICGAGA
jgi:hypothetical protein